jgi:hypothetical protein
LALAFGLVVVGGRLAAPVAAGTVAVVEAVATAPLGGRTVL